MPIDHAPTGLKYRVRRGAASSAAGQIGSQVVSIASLAILLRLVAPGDYGLVGMTLPVVMFLRIITTFGLNVATVQKKELSDDALTTHFWLTVFGGAACVGLAFATAPVVSWLYARPDLHEQLMHLMWALGGMMFVGALGVQHVALLERRMEFGRLATIRVVSQAVGAAAAIAAAIAGWGVWALVVQQYVELGLLGGMAWFAADWRPGLPGASGASMQNRQLPTLGHTERPDTLAASLRLGGYFAAASILLFLADHLDRMMLGRFAGPDAVGLYGQAKNLMIKPVYLVTAPLSAIVLSALARAEKRPAELGETTERGALVTAFYRTLAILLAPLCAGIAVVGEDFMLLLGGSDWIAAGSLLAVLSIGLFAQAVLIINGWILAAVGRTDRLFLSAAVVVAVQGLGYTIGWMVGDTCGDAARGVAWGYTSSVIVLAFPHLLFTLQTAGHSVSPIARSIRTPILASLAMAAVIWPLGSLFLDDQIDLLGISVAIQVVVGAVFYLIAARNELRWFKSQWMQLRNSSR